MIKKPPTEVLIQQFLTKQNIKSINENDLIAICIYASVCFTNVENFISWWNIPNIALGGVPPANLANQQDGLKKISHYVISMAYGIDDWGK